MKSATDRIRQIEERELLRLEPTDPVRRALIGFVAQQVRIQFPELFLTVRSGNLRTMHLFEKHFGAIVDSQDLSARRAKGLQQEDRSWFLLIPEEHGGERHYHGFLRLPHLLHATPGLHHRVLLPSDELIGKSLTDCVRRKLGPIVGFRRNGEERRALAYIDIHARRIYNCDFLQMASYVLKSRSAVSLWADRIERPS